MKYLVVLKGYPRISEVFIAQEIYLLEQLGFDVTILSMRKARESQRQPVNLLIKANVIYLPEYIKPNLKAITKSALSCFFKSPFRFLKILTSKALKSISEKNRSPIKRFFQGVWAIDHLKLFNNTFDFIHTHYVHVPTEMVMGMSELTGVPFSISAHAKDIYTIKKSDLVERVRASRFITTCTKYNYEFLRSLSDDIKDKVNLNYHGLDLDQFKAAPWKFEKNDGKMYFVSVGRLVKKKGYPIIFRALKKLVDKGYEIQYDIFGAGEEEEAILKDCKDLGLSDVINFHFAGTHPEIISLMAKRPCVFICGSVIAESGDRDGIPNTVAEAMSMEVPVVASRVSGVPEIIDDGVDGFLVESGNSSDLAEKLCFLYDNPEKVREVAVNARLKVKEMFESQSLIHPLAELLKAHAKKSELR